MLHRFLETIQEGQVQSLFELSRKLDISTDMVLRIIGQLSDMGYLQEVGMDCNDSEAGCPDCAISSTCQSFVRHWSLTEKGHRTVSRSAETR